MNRFSPGILFFLLLFILDTNVLAAHSTQPQKLIIKITFDWKQKKENEKNPFVGKPIHIEKTVNLDVNQRDYIVALSLTNVSNKLPTTLALLVKPHAATFKNVDLQFNLLQYGFAPQSEVVWTQPHITLENGKTAQFRLPDSSNPSVSIKVSGKWV